MTNWLNKKLRGINRAPPSANFKGSSTDFASELIRSTETDEKTVERLATLTDIDWYTPRLGNNKTFLYMALQKKKAKTAAFLFEKYKTDYATIELPDDYLRRDASPYANNVVSLAVEQDSSIFDSVEGSIKNNILSIILHNIAKYVANTYPDVRDQSIFDKYNNLYGRLLGQSAPVESKNAIIHISHLVRSDEDMTYTKNVDLRRKVLAIVALSNLSKDYIADGVDAPLSGFP